MAGNPDVYRRHYGCVGSRSSPEHHCSERRVWVSEALTPVNIDPPENGCPSTDDIDPPSISEKNFFGLLTVLRPATRKTKKGVSRKPQTGFEPALTGAVCPSGGGPLSSTLAQHQRCGETGTHLCPFGLMLVDAPNEDLCC